MKCLCKRVFLIVSILLFFYACAESYTLFHSLYKTTNSSIIETRQKYSISVFPFLKKCCGYDMMSVSSVHTVAYRSLLALRTVYRNTPISLRIGGKKTYISSVYENHNSLYVEHLPDQSGLILFFSLSKQRSAQSRYVSLSFDKAVSAKKDDNKVNIYCDLYSSPKKMPSRFNYSKIGTYTYVKERELNVENPVFVEDLACYETPYFCVRLYMDNTEEQMDLTVRVYDSNENGEPITDKIIPLYSYTGIAYSLVSDVESNIPVYSYVQLPSQQIQLKTIPSLSQKMDIRDSSNMHIVYTKTNYPECDIYSFSQNTSSPWISYSGSEDFLFVLAETEGFVKNAYSYVEAISKVQ